MPYDSLEWQQGWLAGFAHERDDWPGPRSPGMSCEWIRGYQAGREHYRTAWIRSSKDCGKMTGDKQDAALAALEAIESGAWDGYLLRLHVAIEERRTSLDRKPEHSS